MDGEDLTLKKGTSLELRGFGVVGVKVREIRSRADNFLNFLKRSSCVRRKISTSS